MPRPAPSGASLGTFKLGTKTYAAGLNQGEQRPRACSRAEAFLGRNFWARQSELKAFHRGFASMGVTVPAVEARY